MDEVLSIINGQPELSDPAALREDRADSAEEYKPGLYSQRTCEDCGETFTGKGKERYCRTCRTIRLGMSKGAVRAQCAICGKDFASFNGSEICKDCRANRKDEVKAWFNSQGMIVYKGEHDPNEPPPRNRSQKAADWRKQAKQPIRANLAALGATAVGEDGTRECAVCGAKFTPEAPKQQLCAECRHHISPTREKKRAKTEAKQPETEERCENAAEDVVEAKPECVEAKPECVEAKQDVVETKPEQMKEDEEAVEEIVKNEETQECECSGREGCKCEEKLADRALQTEVVSTLAEMGRGIANLAQALDTTTYEVCSAVGWFAAAYYRTNEMLKRVFEK